MPSRGEVWLVDLGMIQKVRPALILQPGAFLVQNPITISAVKAERFLGRLTTQQLALAEEGVRNWLGL